MRAGLIVLRALRGMCSAAVYQSCIFCGCGVRNATVHVLGVCKLWDTYRASFISAALIDGAQGADHLCQTLLGISPGHSGFVEALAFCDAVDSRAFNFWSQAALHN